MIEGILEMYVYIYIDILKPAPPKGVNKVRVVFPSSME